MTMTIDDHHRRRFGPLSFHHMPSFSSQPHFTDPWASSSSTAPGPHSENHQHSLYTGNQDSAGLPHLNLSALPRQPPPSQQQHSQHSQQHGHHTAPAGTSASMASYASLSVTAPSAVSAPISGVYRQHELLSMPPDPYSLNRLQPPATSTAYDSSAYTTASSPVSATYAPTSASAFEQLGYPPAPLRGSLALPHEDSARRYSQQSVASSYAELRSPVDGGPGVGAPRLGLSDYDHRGLQPDDRKSFQDALEASHGMLSMSQDTPRNIYDVRSRERGSADSYGFPSAHSSASSMSSAGFSGYYGGSVDGSVSDYSATGSDIESLSGRTLPRPQGLMSNQPPAPQSMMGSFSSRVSSSTQKKHKCKVCDKRFTRPSSLQTHMYSHTGEKPFGCEVEGCGRRFSVVSNLRRHKKVHKRGGETPSDTGSETHESP